MVLRFSSCAWTFFELSEAAQELSNKSLRALRWVSEGYELMKCRVRVGFVLGQ